MKYFLFHEETGQGTVEYGMIVAWVAVVALAAVRVFGISLSNRFLATTNTISGNIAS